ncbi:hypothetical protein pb186bvf_020442 [Paramecium bursaria]
MEGQLQKLIKQMSDSAQIPSSQKNNELDLYNIRFWQPTNKQQIQIYDTVKAMIFKNITIPQTMFHYRDHTQIIFDERDIIEHFVSNDLSKLILVWENHRLTEIYDISSNKLIERLQGKILGYFNNKIILDYFFSLGDHEVHLFTVDILNKYRQQYKYETTDQAKVYCFQTNLLITNHQQTKLRFINLNWKEFQIQFKQSLSYPQINYTHNRNYFLLGFQDPDCIKQMVKLTQRLIKINKKVQNKFKVFHDDRSRKVNCLL